VAEIGGAIHNPPKHSQIFFSVIKLIYSCIMFKERKFTKEEHQFLAERRSGRRGMVSVRLKMKRWRKGQRGGRGVKEKNRDV